MEESRRKEHQGGERFSPPWTHLSLVGGQGEVFSMFRDWPAAHKPTFVTARPPAGRAGKGRNFGTRCAGLPKLGMHPDPRQRSWNSRGEKYVLAGGAGQNMIGFSFPACGRGNSARRALPGESIGRKDWMPCREAPNPKAFPLGVEQSGGLFGQVQAKPRRSRKRGLPTVAPTEFFFCSVGQPGRPLISHLR